jgi:hypothetical protein
MFNSSVATQKIMKNISYEKDLTAVPQPAVTFLFKTDQLVKSITQHTLISIVLVYFPWFHAAISQLKNIIIKCQSPI